MRSSHGGSGHRSSIAWFARRSAARFSSRGTQEAAETIARELGARFTVLSIDDAFQRELEAYALQNRFLASVYSPDRVSYGGGRPACDVPAETQTHRARSVKEADAVEQ